MSEGGVAWLAGDLWTAEQWGPAFPHRPDLARELTVLERLFPSQWRDDNLVKRRARHQLLWHLATPGGRARLLDLAAELLRLMRDDQYCRAAADERIPMEGRLRWWNLYQPTKSEFLVGPILLPLGDVTWQPERAGQGADYKVTHRSGVLVAEVKRLCTSRRHFRLETQRALATMGRSGPLFSPDENRSFGQEDAKRLYKRVRYAAGQLKISARKAAPKDRAHGVLFLDLDGNNYLVNLVDTICGWMAAGAASPKARR
jgi:hypothetical protein